MVFRFYIRCTRCNAEFTFKTDPKNSDYTAEHNCCRNFEPWRAKEAIEDQVNEHIKDGHAVNPSADNVKDYEGKLTLHPRQQNGRTWTTGINE
mgnify:CR=1 FL=1